MKLHTSDSSKLIVLALSAFVSMSLFSQYSNIKCINNIMFRKEHHGIEDGPPCLDSIAIDPPTGWDAAVAATLSYCKNVIPQLIEKTKGNDGNHNRFAMNELRREIALYGHPDCLKKDHFFDVFADSFMSRPQRRHFNLHIPKAAGTTVCKKARATPGMTTSQTINCWVPEVRPYWCCGDMNDRYLPTQDPCQYLQRYKRIGFVMNEQWFEGFCQPSRTYSVMIREPVSRAISATRHFMKSVKMHIGERKEQEWGPRLNIIQHNYLTWSLTANPHFRYNSTIKNTGTNTTIDPSLFDPKFFHPREQHLKDAARALRRMDFLIDLTYKDTSCTETILSMMHFKNTSAAAQANSFGAGDYKSYFDEENFARMNSLDIPLYEHSQQILEADCWFFKKLQEREDHRKQT